MTNVFRPALIKPGNAMPLSRWFTKPPSSRDVVVDTRVIHSLGRGQARQSRDAIADDLLRVLHAVCQDRINDVALVVSPDSGFAALRIGTEKADARTRQTRTAMATIDRRGGRP